MKRSPLFANPFAAAVATAAASKRRRVDRLIGDRLTVLPSSLLRHCLLSFLSFEEWMQHIRLLSRSVRQLVEDMAVQWMNATFPSALAVIDKKQRKLVAAEVKRRRLRDWATTTSSALPSTLIDLTDPQVTFMPATFTVKDAEWVNRHLHHWATVMCNRGVDLSRHQRDLLRVPEADTSREFHVPWRRLGELKRGRPVDEVINGRRLTRSAWLMDVLTWVLEEWGHAEPFLALHQRRRTTAQSTQQKLQEARAKNKDPERLKAAMEAEGWTGVSGWWSWGVRGGPSMRRRGLCG